MNLCDSCINTVEERISKLENRSPKRYRQWSTERQNRKIEKVKRIGILTENPF